MPVVPENWLERELTDGERTILDRYPLTFRAVRYPVAYRCPLGSWGLEIGPGWYPLVEQAAAVIESELQAMLASVPLEQLLVTADALGLDWSPPIQPATESRPLLPFVSQVKEKMGGLRIYLHAGSQAEPERWERILAACRVAEARSEHMCEGCGEPGTLRKDGWWRVLCDACEQTRT